MPELWVEIVGYFAAGLTIVSLLPQLIKIIVSKSSRDVALEAYFICVLFEILWSIYGIYTKNLQILITNVTCCVISTLIIVFGYYYRYTQNSSNASV